MPESLRAGIDRFCNQTSRKMARGDTVAAITVNKKQVIPDLADMRNTRHGQREITAPGKFNIHTLELREGFLQLGQQLGDDIRRLCAAIGRATAPTTHTSASMLLRGAARVGDALAVAA